jgi:copper chaperone NosL
MTLRRFTALVTGALVSSAWAVSLEGPPAASAGATGEPAHRIEAGKRDVCAVCGMLVARHPEWLAQVVYEDGSQAFFDGPKDLFKYLLRPERYAADKRGVETTAVLVTSYYVGAATDARQAFYVVGSDVTGPMGAELVPHPTLEAAEEFARDHHGERIVRFDDVTPELLNELE